METPTTVGKVPDVPPLLFHKYNLRDVLANCQVKAVEVVRLTDPDTLLATPVEDLVDQLVAQFKVEPPALRPLDTVSRPANKLPLRPGLPVSCQHKRQVDQRGEPAPA